MKNNSKWIDIYKISDRTETAIIGYIPNTEEDDEPVTLAVIDHETKEISYEFEDAKDDPEVQRLINNVFKELGVKRTMDEEYLLIKQLHELTSRYMELESDDLANAGEFAGLSSDIEDIAIKICIQGTYLSEDKLIEYLDQHHRISSVNPRDVKPGSEIKITVYDCFMANATVIEVLEDGLVILIDEETMTSCYSCQSNEIPANPLFVEYDLIADLEILQTDKAANADWFLCKDVMPEFNRECWITVINYETKFKPKVYVDILNENGQWRSKTYPQHVIAWRYKEQKPQPYSQKQEDTKWKYIK